MDILSWVLNSIPMIPAKKVMWMLSTGIQSTDTIVRLNSCKSPKIKPSSNISIPVRLKSKVMKLPLNIHAMDNKKQIIWRK